MGEAKWTDEQLLAITESGRNLLVAAAAGAGKTAVLVERIIRKILDGDNPIDIDKLLVVTFTNAAAAEMRERIGNALSRAIEGSKDANRLQKQLTLLNKASITTIHSFCLEVIRNNFHYIDLDPAFRIADDTECTLMKLEILEELFDDMYEEGNLSEGFIQLVECYGGSRDDRQLMDMVLSIYEFIQSCPWPEQWLEEKTQALKPVDTEDFGTSPWAELILKNIRIELSGSRAMLERALNIVLASEGLSPYISCLREDISIVENLEKSCFGSWDNICNAFSVFEFGRLARCGKDADKVRQEEVKLIRDDVKKRIKKIYEDLFIFDSQQIYEDLKHIYPAMKALSELVIEFGKRYSFKKREKSLLDFSDLEHLCLEILTKRNEDGSMEPSKAALLLRERFDEILVDEYQDSNLIQDQMLKIISRNESNVFMVGDVKQSIYRFRQAKPELFLQKYDLYPDCGGAINRKILLYKNFRSREEVINSVNYIFKQIMSKNAGELDYDEREALNLGASFLKADESEAETGGAVELHLLDMSEKEGSYEDPAEDIQTEAEDEQTDAGVEEEITDSIKGEALLVVKRIKKLMNPDKEGRYFKIYDKDTGDYRKLHFKDIVILLRSTKNWAEVFSEELGSYGIPSFADSGSGYFNTIEVQVIMSLLQIIDNPIQDIPLLSVLRSPIAGFTPDELIDIRVAEKDASIYEAMRKTVTLKNGTVSVKCAEFLEKLSIWRRKALYTSTDELIWYLYDETGYYSFTGAMPGGLQRQANLRILFERARQYEETSYKGLFNFINFINKLKSSSGDMGSAKILGENEDVVRIMSIHKSKGLEFPVVFVSGCGKGFNLQDMQRSILIHQDLGFGPDYVDHKRRISYPTVLKQALKYKTKIESLSEEMRILYVAFTRAREKLIITGTLKNLVKSLSKWSGCAEIDQYKLPDYEMLKARSYLDWIGPALMRHRGFDGLRKLAGVKLNDIKAEKCLIEDSSIWKVNAWSIKDIIPQSANNNQVDLNIKDRLNSIDLLREYSNYGKEVERRLEWSYPYSKASSVAAKFSVTEIKRLFDASYEGNEIEESVILPKLNKKPKFLEGTRGLNAAEKGTIMHFVMQHLDLKKAAGMHEIQQQIDAMIMNELLTEQQAKAVDRGKIVSFFNSDLGKRMLKSEKVKREVPFNLEISCSEIYSDMSLGDSKDEKVLLQGIIDCYFEEQDGVVLLDYKTGYVPEGDTKSVSDRYRLQLELYERALTMVTGMKVTGKYIYLFWNGEIVEITAK